MALDGIATKYSMKIRIELSKCYWDTVYVTESHVTRDTFIGFLKFKFQDFSINSGDRVLRLAGLGL